MVARPYRSPRRAIHHPRLRRPWGDCAARPRRVLLRRDTRTHVEALGLSLSLRLPSAPPNPPQALPEHRRRRCMPKRLSTSPPRHTSSQTRTPWTRSGSDTPYSHLAFGTNCVSPLPFFEGVGRLAGRVHAHARYAGAASGGRRDTTMRTSLVPWRSRSTIPLRMRMGRSSANLEACVVWIGNRANVCVFRFRGVQVNLLRVHSVNVLYSIP